MNGHTQFGEPGHEELLSRKIRNDLDVVACPMQPFSQGGQLSLRTAGPQVVNYEEDSHHLRFQEKPAPVKRTGDKKNLTH